MNILLEELPHQEQALAAILASFTGIDHAQADHNHYANPLIKERYDDKANIDVKMETGTGKTYVYTRLMYELHQKYGLRRQPLKKARGTLLPAITPDSIFHSSTKIRGWNFAPSTPVILK